MFFLLEVVDWIPVVAEGSSGSGDGFWLFDFCKVLLPPVRPRQDGHDLDMLSFLDHLFHRSPVGSPTSWKVSLLWGPKPSLSCLEEHPFSWASYPHPMDVFSGNASTTWSLFELALSQNLCHSEWIQHNWSQMGPCGCNSGVILFLRGSMCLAPFPSQSQHFIP